MSVLPSSWPSTEARWRSPLRLVLLLILLSCWTPGSSQSINTAVNLSFGSFSPGSGGTITVSTAGARSKTGGVLLVGQGSAAAAAQLVISGGTSNANVVISLPTDGSTQLDDGSGHTMALNSFSSSPSLVGTLSGAGTLTLYVGATLTVGNLQTPGNYSGFFGVTINYE